MSYEGFVQNMCKNKHYWTEDAYDQSGICPECNEPAIWDNDVDETNCESSGYVVMEVDKQTECPHCHAFKKTYKIPKEGRHI